MITIIDYQAGNIGSIRNMLLRLGHDSLITQQPEEIERATHIILPGVGSFDYGMRKLSELGLVNLLEKKIQKDKIPVLGICLGAQLMCNQSEEGSLRGLGWIKGSVRKFNTEVDGKRYPVPHIGWDYVQPVKPSRAFEGLVDAKFYFVHSYYIHCDDQSDTLTKNEYGHAFDSSFERDNILGVQFHPEKSHTFGKGILKNFAEKY